jgi:hypothetical protein
MTRMTSSVVGEAMVSMNAGSRAATCAKLKRSELRSSSMMPSAHAPSMTLFMCCTSGCGRTFGMTMTPCGSPATHSTARQCDAAAPRRPACAAARPATAHSQPGGHRGDLGQSRGRGGASGAFRTLRSNSNIWASSIFEGCVRTDGAGWLLRQGLGTEPAGRRARRARAAARGRGPYIYKIRLY